jgi:hypothetical protein
MNLLIINVRVPDIFKCDEVLRLQLLNCVNARAALAWAQIEYLDIISSW